MNLNKRVIRIYMPIPYDDTYDDVKLHRRGENINRASKNNLQHTDITLLNLLCCNMGKKL